MSENIGKRIKIQRKKLKLTQEDLAKMVNVSSQVISNWEREYSRPDSNDIQKISAVLQLTADYILTGNIINDLDEELSDWMNLGKYLKEKGYSLTEIGDLIDKMIKTFTN